MNDFDVILSNELSISKEHAANVIKLIEEGCTIPFIARYRKEMHGSMNDQVLRIFADRYQYLKNLTESRENVRRKIEEKGKLTAKINKALDNATTLIELDDIYRPYKGTRQTRGTKALDANLNGLADILMLSTQNRGTSIVLAEKFINNEKGYDTPEKALQGALDIIAEEISNDSDLKKVLRNRFFNSAILISTLKKDKDAGLYEQYKDYQEPANKMPSHRILAVNRGEKEDILRVKLVEDEEAVLNIIKEKYIKSDLFYKDELLNACKDGYKRLIAPSLERESRNILTDKANEQAIKMFESNLKPLLMQPPLKGKVILGFDPAYRTGCKLAVIDSTGKYLAHKVIFPHIPQEKRDEAKATLLELVKSLNVDVIALGNGTASKESEIFIAEFIKENKLDIQYAIVNEAGASVYSASELAAEEFPNMDVSFRSAVSIARRLQDPLAELVKIDVKSIGVGQYQHDMPQKRLADVLNGVVEDCVNDVGVDLNTASPSLLSYVSGLNIGIAKNIVEFRKNKPFETRDELLQVNSLKGKTFEQCAGFLRIPRSENILDNTGVHPESYEIAKALLKKYNIDAATLKKGDIKLIEKIKKDGASNVAKELNVGEPTLMDIASDLEKPGRDIRESLRPVELRADILDINSLQTGMELNGTVRNVIDFGAFVDIGVHQDGLIHRSQISKQYVNHPSDVLKVGDVVIVKIISVDVASNKINLSLFTDENPNGIKIQGAKENFGKRNNQFAVSNKNKHDKPQKSLEDSLLALQKKFNSK